MDPPEVQGPRPGRLGAPSAWLGGLALAALGAMLARQAMRLPPLLWGSGGAAILLAFAVAGTWRRSLQTPARPGGRQARRQRANQGAPVNGDGSGYSTRTRRGDRPGRR